MTMRCLETTFLVDLVRGDPMAETRTRAFEDAGEPTVVASPTVAELLQGAHFRGGAVLAKTLELLGSIDVLPIDEDVAAEAGRTGAELLRRGLAMSTVDLLIAAAAKRNRCILVTRDAAYSRIPDLAVETY